MCSDFVVDCQGYVPLISAAMVTWNDDVVDEGVVDDDPAAAADGDDDSNDDDYYDDNDNDDDWGVVVNGWSGDDYDGGDAGSLTKFQFIL